MHSRYISLFIVLVAAFPSFYLSVWSGETAGEGSNSTHSDWHSGLEINYTGTLRPLYSMPLYSASVTLNLVSSTFSSTLIGMDESGQQYPATRINMMAPADLTAYSIPRSDGDMVPASVTVTPFVNTFLNSSGKMPYTYAGTGQMNISGKTYLCNLYKNSEWNSYRWYGYKSGLMLKIVEYYGMATVKLTADGSIIDVLPNSSSASAICQEPSAPWASPLTQEDNVYDSFLWNKYSQIYKAIPNFTRVHSDNGHNIITNKTLGLAFDTASESVFSDIAHYLEVLLPDETDRLIGATLFVSRAAVVFSPIVKSPYITCTVFSELNDSITSILTGHYKTDDPPSEVLRAGYGLCGAKSLVLSRLFREMGYSAGTLDLECRAGGYTMAHIVSVLYKGGDFYVFDPMYQQFYFNMDNTTLTTYENMMFHPQIIKRWGVMFLQGTPYRYELAWMYANSTISDIFIPTVPPPPSSTIPWAAGIYSLFMGLFITIIVLALALAHTHTQGTQGQGIKGIYTGSVMSALAVLIMIYYNTGFFVYWLVYMSAFITALLMGLYVAYILSD